MRLNRQNLTFLLLAGSILVSTEGCMVGPDYQRPDVIEPDAWHAKLVDSMSTDEDGPGAWWNDFDDAVLVELLRRAGENNLDLRTMVSRIDAARAAYGIAAADLFPTVDGTGRALWYRADGAGAPVAGIPGSSGESYSLGLEMTWELDLWGRVRRTMQARESDVIAAVENWRDMLVTVRAEVAASYINYRTYRARAELNGLAIAAAGIALKIAEQEYEAGTAPYSTVLSARSQLENFKSTLPSEEAASTQALNQISILLGEAPGALEELVGDAGEIPVPPAEIGIGMPADVIRQRPDIRSAERSLASASELIGATEALLLPQFTLTGGLGYQANSGSELLDWSNRNWSIGPSMNWSLLNWGSIESQIDRQKAFAEEALISYQSTILGAYQEVENALVGFASSEVSRRSSADARNDILETLVLMLQSYEAGTVDLASVVQIELQYLDAEYTLLNLEGQVAQAAVSLFKAMGGDWTPMIPGPDGPVPVSQSDASSVTTRDGGDSQ
ncbi:MAG: efflux transporter outer membrane subunit [Phycisphaerales bacterium]|nr:efflux transporter outer membrane subunit [Phycisphaerales bacterium]